MDIPSSCVSFQFSGIGHFIICKILYQDNPDNYILFAATDFTDEDMADACHSKLKDDESMIVEGGGELEIRYDESIVIIKSLNSRSFGSSQLSVVKNIIEKSFDSYEIKFEQQQKQ